jgi:peptidoglycan/LPS O-acetylase OafA/YrhL
VTGLNRLMFILLSLSLVVGFYKITIPIPQFIAFPLEKLGLITYGVYILHPIVKPVIHKMCSIVGIENHLIILGAIIVATIVVSLISYYLMELPLMKLGKKLTSKS